MYPTRYATRYATRALLPLALSGLAVLSACSDTGTGPGTQGRVSLNVATRASSGASASRASFAVTSPTPGTFSDGTNTLVLSTVQLVLREIELKRTVESSTCATETSGSSNDNCEEFEVGPVLLDVPAASAGAEQTVSASVEAGTYREIEFELHKPSGSDDAAFLQANPGFAGVSVRVAGTYNGAPFTFTSDVEAEQEIELATPLTVAQTGTTDLTLFVDVSHWFDAGNGTLLDPATANAGQPNESIVEANIKNSFRAFEDKNRDGVED